MALAIDGSSPAIATGAGPTVTTASFTPPAGALLLVEWAGNSSSGANPGQPTITDNLGGHLTYTLVAWQSHANSPTVDGQAAAWWAPVVSSAAMTVSVTNQDSGNPDGALKVTVFTGADTSGIGASGKSGSASASSIAQSYTAQATGGWGFLVDCDWDTLGAQTAGSGCTFTSGGTGSVGSAISYGFLRRTSADDTNGGSNSLNVTIPGTSNHLSWVYTEIKPASTSTPSYPFGLIDPRNRLRGWRIPRARITTPVRAQVNPPIPPAFTDQPRRIRGLYLRRGRSFSPVREQVNPPWLPTAVVPVRRLRGLRPRRGEVVTPVPAQVVLTPPMFVPQPGRARPRWVWPRRRDLWSPTPTQVPAPLSTRSRRPLVRLVRHGRSSLAPLEQTGLAGMVQRSPLRLPLVPRGLAVAPVPAPVVVAPPSYVVGVVRARRRWPALLRRGSVVEWWPQALDVSCETPRPSTGVTARPSSGVTVRAAGVTTRPGSGVTARPDTGITEDPC